MRSQSLHSRSCVVINSQTTADKQKKSACKTQAGFYSYRLKLNTRATDRYPASSIVHRPSNSPERNPPKACTAHNAAHTAGPHGKYPVCRHKCHKAYLMSSNACIRHRPCRESGFPPQHGLADSTSHIAYKETQGIFLLSLRQRRQPLSCAARITHFIWKLNISFRDFRLQNQ